MKPSNAPSAFFLMMLWVLWTFVCHATPTASKHHGAMPATPATSPSFTVGDPTLEIGTHELAQEAREQLRIFPRHQVPQIRRLHQPGALLMAVNIKQIALLPGDRVVIRDARNATTITITARNQSITKSALKRPTPVLWNHPFVVTGSRVTIEYWPSLLTLVLPIHRKQLDNAVLVVDSYTFAFLPGRRSGMAGQNDSSTDLGDRSEDADDGDDGNTESTIGLRNEMKPAICYKTSDPDWYAKARSVARLIIQRDPEELSGSSRSFGQVAFRSPEEQHSPSPREPPMWTFCTGWLIGRGNHMLTNYHCFFQLTKPIRNGMFPSPQASSSRLRSMSREPTTPCPSASTLGVPRGSTPRVVYAAQASVNFMEESLSCNVTDKSRGHVGNINATEVEILAASEALDYCLVRVHPRSSRATSTGSQAEEQEPELPEEDLAKTFGYLTVRARGPVDGEPIYIPQHPNGEPKTIASVKDGKSAIIRVGRRPGSGLGRGSFAAGTGSSVAVWYNADTAPGSSGSPVLSQLDNTVVALHRAGTGMRPSMPPTTRSGASRWAPGLRRGGSGGVSGGDEEQLNVGIRIDAIVADMREKDVLPPCVVAVECKPAINATTGNGLSGSRRLKNEKSPCCETTW